MSRRAPIYRRCGCTEVVDGKRRQLGQGCPKLRRADGSWNPRHGTWTFSASVIENGRRVTRVRGGFATYAEAESGLEKARTSLKAGGSTRSDRITVGEYLDEWLDAKADVKRSTLRAYRQHVDKWLRPALGRRRLGELRTAHVAEALAAVTSSDSNRQRVRATLRTALNDAVREGLLTTNPAALVKLASGKRPRALVWTAERVARWQETGVKPSAVMVWTPAQLGTFLDAADGDRLAALWHLYAFRGLRRGEAVGLPWSEVDLDAGTLAIRRQHVQLGWEIVEDTPKSDAGERTIALDAATVGMLRGHRRRQLEERLAWGAAWTDTGLVFTREDGIGLHPATVTDRFHAVRQSAGLPPIRLHDLRHGAASLMLAAGVDLKVVSETLGHSTLGLTADTYTSVYTEVAAEAAERTAALVPRAHTGTAARTLHAHPADEGLTDLSAGPLPAGTAWGRSDLNRRLADYESAALTS